MDLNLLAFLHNAGLDRYVELITAVIAVASAANMLVPQPAPGSHWLPARKVLNALALAFSNAKPANEPPLATWVQRCLMVLAQSLPPPPPPAAPQPAPQPPMQPSAPIFPPRVAPPPVVWVPPPVTPPAPPPALPPAPAPEAIPPAAPPTPPVA